MKLSVVILVVLVLHAFGEDNFGSARNIVFKIYEDCAVADMFSTCLKKKAITFLDRLGRMEKFVVGDGITIKTNASVQNNQKQNDIQKLEYRDSKDDNLNSILLNKISEFIDSKTVEISFPKFPFHGLEKGRKGGGSSAGGGGGKGGMKGMMGGLMMGIAAKMVAMIPVAVAGLFLLAGKALITAKIALLLSGIIAIKKLFSTKHGSATQGGTWQSNSNSGGWSSNGGGWNKRSIDPMAYNAYISE